MKTPRYGSGRGFALACVVLLGSTLLGGLYGTSVRATAGDPADLQESVHAVSRVLAVVQQNYALPVDTD